MSLSCTLSPFHMYLSSGCMLRQLLILVGNLLPPVCCLGEEDLRSQIGCPTSLTMRLLVYFRVVPVLVIGV